MNTVFLILTLLCFLVLIIGLIKPSALVKKEEAPTRKKILRTLIPLMLIFFVLFGLTTDSPSSSIAETKQTVATQPPATPTKATIEQQIEKIIQDTTQKNLKQVNISQVDGEKNIVVIHIIGKENLTTSMTRKGIYRDGADLFKKLYTSGLPIKEVAEIIYMPLTDKYGNTSDDVVVKMTLNSTTAAKINWNGVDTLNFNKVADSSWIHPALLKE